jgi:hypothetical protein
MELLVKPEILKSYIQGDSGGICNTLGNDSMCDSKQKSSYNHVSDFRRLRSYGYFFISRTHPRVNRAYGIS